MHRLFTSLDLVSQRILVICLSICFIMLCASCLVLSVTHAFAGTASKPPLDIVGVGCDASYAYYYDASGTLRREPLSGATDR